MAVKKNLITEDLDWAEQQLETWRQYIDTHPFTSLKDRKGSNIENQMKAIRETMRDYLSMMETVKKLRTDEEKKQEIAKGNMGIPQRMQSVSDGS